MSSAWASPGATFQRAAAVRGLRGSVLPTPGFTAGPGPQLVGRDDPDAPPVLHLLVADEDPSVRDACAEIARKMGFAVTAAPGLAAAKEILKYQKIDLLLLDVEPGVAGVLEAIEDIKAARENTEIIVMTASASVSGAVDAMRTGARDYLAKPFSLHELVATLSRAGEHRHFDLESRRVRERLRVHGNSPHLVGQSPAMEKLFRILAKAANSSHPVLILGETGTGKELVARSIHMQSPSAHRPFVPIDCGSLSSELIESELFGCDRGGPLGSRNAAHIPSAGLLSSVTGGTVFLDEIAALSPVFQGKLLRALQERQVTPVGGSQAAPITARVLAASSRDLPAMVAQGLFRKDLYFRLNVVGLRIPPLRERPGDIPSLAQHFLERQGSHGWLFSDDALRALIAYEWPGNVRELEAAVGRACAMSSGPVLQSGDLPTQLHTYRRYAHPDGSHAQLPESEPEPNNPRIVSLADLEREAILETVRQLKGDKLMAAKLLGIGKTTLYRKLKEYGVGEGFAEG